MGIFNRLFGKSENSEPQEPIFPGESFSILKLDMKDGLAFATVNKAYHGYPNKAFYPFFVGVELTVNEKNENGHPVDVEAARLNQVQDEIEGFLKTKQTVHSVARVTRNGARDLLIYIDKPTFTQEDLNTLCDKIQHERQMNFSVQHDPSWNAVEGLLSVTH